MRWACEYELQPRNPTRPHDPENAGRLQELRLVAPGCTKKLRPPNGPKTRNRPCINPKIDPTENHWYAIPISYPLKQESLPANSHRLFFTIAAKQV